MKCLNCGAEFQEGIFCPECGTKIKENATRHCCGETTAEVQEDNNVTKTQSVHVENLAQRRVKKSKKEVPWYLSIIFIIVVYMCTMCLWGIPGILLSIIRLLKCKTKRKSSIVTLVILILPIVLLIWLIIAIISETEEIENLIESGQCIEARELLDEKMENDSSYSYVELYCESYEAEGKYDEAANVIIQYCYACESPMDITNSAINKLEQLKEKVSQDIYDEIVIILESVEKVTTESAFQIEEKNSQMENDELVTEEQNDKIVQSTTELVLEEQREEEDGIPLVCDTLIRITYEKQSFAYNDDVVILIDDIEVGKISAGDSAVFEVVLGEGMHVIQARSDTLIRSNNSNKYEFETKYDFQEVLFNLEEVVTGLKISMDE